MRVTRFGVLFAGVAVVAAGCGTIHATSSNGLPVSVAAAARGTSVRTARIAETTTMRMSAMSISYTATGEFDFAHARGMLAMQAPFDTTMLFLPPTTYVKIPGGVGSALPKGKTWVALDAKGPGGPADPGLGIFGASSPADLLTSLTTISGSVKKLGSGSIRGVAVTGYRVIIDPRKAARAAKLNAAERASYQQFVAGLGTGAISADVWVDGGNLVRRVTLSVRPSAALSAGLGGTGAAAQMTASTDFYDFGVPVNVSPPPAAQIASMGQIISAQGSVSSGSGFTGPPGTPPAVSGTLTPDQAAAAEHAVTAFFAALGRNDTAALAQTVLPAQLSCVPSAMSGAPTITVKSLRIISATPAGTGKATVRFTVAVTGSIGGMSFPVLAPSSGGRQWLVTAEADGRWYVDLTASTALLFSGPC